MKLGLLLFFFLSWTAGRVLAQQGLDAAVLGTNSVSHYDTRRWPLIIDDGRSSGLDRVTLKKRVELKGPLAGLFKVKKVLDLPRQLLHLINPFAAGEARDEGYRRGDLDPRAWTTIVGWHPGQSAFPDAVTQEPCMSFLSLGFERSNK